MIAPAYNWIGDQSNDWADPANWLSNIAPGPGDHVGIGPGSPYYPQIGAASVSVNSIYIAAGGSLGIATGGLLIVATRIINAGTISGSGEINAIIDNSGGTIEAQGATLILDGAVTNGGNFIVGSGSVLNAAGGGAVDSLTFSGAAGVLGVGTQALTVTNTINLTPTNTINVAGGTLTALNGLVDEGVISGYGAVQGNVSGASGVVSATNGGLTFTGSLEGSLTLQIGGSPNASILLDAGGSAASVVFTSTSGGTLTVASGQELTVDNSLAVNSHNTIVLQGPDAFLVASGGVTIAGGQINGGTVVSDGPISGYGTISSALATTQTITASGGGALNLTGAQSSNNLHVAADGSLNLSGWSGAINSLTFDSAGASATIGSNITVVRGLTVGSNDTLTVNGTLRELAGVTLAGGTLAGGGSLTAGTNVTGNGAINLDINGKHTITAAGGELVINGNVDQVAGTPTGFQINSGGILTFNGAVGGAGGSPTVTFAAGGAGRLNVAESVTPQFGTIRGFKAGDIIDLNAFINGTVSVHGNQAEFALGSHHLTLTFIQSDPLNGLSFNNADGEVTICFMPGTMIRTPDGEVAVETLQPGDLVLNHRGEAKPVNWVGRQTLSRRFSQPLRSWPVRVSAGALGPQTPGRDLLLSPDHALWVEGVLIQAAALVNGTSITRETTVPDVWTYYHVELDDHSLILAEGAPAETFVDNVDRMRFDNWAEYKALYPEGKTVAELPYPRAKAHRQVPVYIRIKLAERALALTGAAAA